MCTVTKMGTITSTIGAMDGLEELPPANASPSAIAKPELYTKSAALSR